MTVLLIEGLAQLVGAYAAWIVFVTSSPKRKLWLPMPGYVRFPTLAFSVFLTWQGADSLWLVLHPEHADYTRPISLINCVTAAWYFGAVAISVVRTRAPKALWHILEKAALEWRGGRT